MKTADQEISELRGRLDALQAGQMALMNVVTMLMAPLKADPRAIAELGRLTERGKAQLLASSASDYQIHAYDDLMKALVEKVVGSVRK